MSARKYIWEYSRQFKCQCAIPQPGESVDDIIKRCREARALAYEPGDPEPLFVVQLSADVGAEVWTEEALRSSLEPKKEA